MNVNELITHKRKRLSKIITALCNDMTIAEWNDLNAEQKYLKMNIEELENIEQPTIEYSRKVKLPQFIINTMNGYDSLHDMLAEEYFNNSTEEINSDEIQCWIGENFDKLCRAWLDNDYEVEEEPKYYVKVGEKLYFKGWGEDGQSPEFIIDCHFYSKQGAYVCDSKEVAQKIASEVGGTVEKEGTK